MAGPVGERRPPAFRCKHNTDRGTARVFRCMTQSTTSSVRNALSGIASGPGAMLILLGVVLFVIPEPITSVLGVLVILAGVAAWAVGTLF